MAAGDFNRDGAPDLMVTLNDSTVNLALITGLDDGSFNPPIHFTNATRFDSPAIAAVDLDNDGNLDVVVGHSIACYQAPCIPATSITVMHGRGDGTFQAPRVIDVGSGTAAIDVGDFTRDAFSDLVIASSSSRVHVLLGRGDGTFVQQTLTLISENNIGMDNTDIDVADVNAALLGPHHISGASPTTVTAARRGPPLRSCGYACPPVHGTRGRADLRAGSRGHKSTCADCFPKRHPPDGCGRHRPAELRPLSSLIVRPGSEQAAAGARWRYEGTVLHKERR